MLTEEIAWVFLVGNFLVIKVAKQILCTYYMQISQCPPYYLLDSRKRCGGDEYDAYIMEKDEENILYLETLDMQNGLYLFRLPAWADEIPEIRFDTPKLFVNLIFSRCQGIIRRK